MSGLIRRAEWAPQRTVYTAWPRLAEEWGPAFAPAQEELASLVTLVAAPRPGPERAPEVVVLVGDAPARSRAEAALGDVPGVRLLDAPYGDVWLRDIGPLFLEAPDGTRRAAAFRFDGWGGKYTLPGDQETASAVAQDAGLRLDRVPLVAEGGALEHDGGGTVLTTRACLLGGPRNPGLDRAGAEAHLAAGIGAQRVVWLDATLANDHTDGHIDTLARFTPDGGVAHMTAAAEDPNERALGSVARDLVAALPEAPRHPIPSPGAVLDEDGRPMPASYLNFLVTNGRVVVPTYGAPQDAAALDALAAAFPGHRVIGSSALALLTGGGAFHCVTQERPWAPGEDS